MPRAARVSLLAQQPSALAMAVMAPSIAAGPHCPSTLKEAPQSPLAAHRREDGTVSRRHVSEAVLQLLA